MLAKGNSLQMDSRPACERATAVWCFPGPSDLGVHTCGKPICLNQQAFSQIP